MFDFDELDEVFERQDLESTPEQGFIAAELQKDAGSYQWTGPIPEGSLESADSSAHVDFHEPHGRQKTYGHGSPRPSVETLLQAAQSHDLETLRDGFLSAGCSVDELVLIFDMDGNTMLHLCVSSATLEKDNSEEVVCFLLAARADVDATNLLGETVLLSAVRANDSPQLGTCRALLEGAADPGQADTLAGETALMEAACRGDPDLCSLLLAWRADPLQKNEHGLSAQDLAAEVGSEDVISLLASTGCSPSKPMSLRAAVRACDAEAVRRALLALGPEAEAALDAIDGSRATLLHLCAVDPTHEDAAEVARILVDAGARVNMPDSAGREPIDLALTAGLATSQRIALDLIRVLLVARASPTAADVGLSHEGVFSQAEPAFGQELRDLLRAFDAESCLHGESDPVCGSVDSRESPTLSLRQRCDDAGIPLGNMGDHNAEDLLCKRQRWMNTSVKELRAECSAHCISTGGVIEKEDLVQRLQKFGVWKAIDLQSLEAECLKYPSLSVEVSGSSGNVSRDILEDALLAAAWDGSGQKSRVRAQCEGKGIPLDRLSTVDQAPELLQQIERMESSSTADIKRAYKKWGIPLESGMEKGDLVARLRNVLVWEALPMAELRKECGSHGVSVKPEMTRMDLLKRLVSAAWAPPPRRPPPSRQVDPPVQEKRQPAMPEFPLSGMGSQRLKANIQRDVQHSYFETNPQKEVSGSSGTSQAHHPGLPGGQVKRDGPPPPGGWPRGQHPGNPNGAGSRFGPNKGKPRPQQQAPPPAPASIEDHFRTLGLPRSAGPNEVRKAYRKLALQHHPDKNPGKLQETAATQFRKVAAAYEAVCRYMGMKGGR